MSVSLSLLTVSQYFSKGSPYMSIEYIWLFGSRRAENLNTYMYISKITQGCFPFSQTNSSETSGTNQLKMEQHWSIEAKSPTRSKHLAILSEVGLEKRNFGNGIVTLAGRNRLCSLKGHASGGGPHFRIISKWTEKLNTEMFHLYFI